MNVRTPLSRLGFVAASTALAAGAWIAPAQANPSAPWIGPGQANTYNGVRCFQELFNDLQNSIGYHPIAEDGAFGPDTAGAIRAFQSWDGLRPDGIVGPQTGGDLLIATYGGGGCATHIPSRY
ncbi:peptidoglycan-binding domain-containing protein [Streptomyces sp. NPDC051180]|uniref:peptidoglycan-binding domain-containing protein n=1 Tax=unclassified Streptomyces TaxID=2593676 RepID=UPI00344FB00B